MLNAPLSLAMESEVRVQNTTRTKKNENLGPEKDQQNFESLRPIRTWRSMDPGYHSESKTDIFRSLRESDLVSNEKNKNEKILRLWTNIENSFLCLEWYSVYQL